MYRFNLDRVCPLYIKERSRAELRKSLLKTMRNCIVTGWQYDECDCAHIIPRYIGHKIGYQDTDTTNNCVLLSQSIHKLFDDYVWALDEDWRIVSKTKSNSILHEYVGKKVVVPEGTVPAFKVHYKIFSDLYDESTSKIRSMDLTENYREYLLSERC